MEHTHTPLTFVAVHSTASITIAPIMTQAWRDAGESWLAVNSRIVSVHLQLSEKHPSGSQQFVYIISVYAPTHRE